MIMVRTNGMLFPLIKTSGNFSRLSRSRLTPTVFIKFSRHNSTAHYPDLLKETLSRYVDLELQPFRVECSKRFGRPFSSAKVSAFPYCEDENKKVVDPYQIDFSQSRKIKSFYLDFKPLFGSGMEEVDRIVSQIDKYSELENEPGNSESTRTANLTKAVKTLGHFLQNIDYHQRCLADMAENKDASYSELEVTVLLATHLFSPLVSYDTEDQHQHCIITNDSESIFKTCPCAENCDAKIAYGNFGFGSRYLWYGKSDIMLYPLGGGAMDVSISVSEEEPVTNFENQACRQIIEMESQLRVEKNIDQVVSQAITFAFYQKKYQKEKLQYHQTKLKENNDNTVITTLIPTIFASARYFDIYLYDPENDVLLRNLDEPIPIFEKSGRKFCKFDLNSVLQLWMLINHLLLQPKFSAQQLHTLKETCGVKKQIEASDFMKKVEETLMIKAKFESPQLKKPSTWSKLDW